MSANNWSNSKLRGKAIAGVRAAIKEKEMELQSAGDRTARNRYRYQLGREDGQAWAVDSRTGQELPGFRKTLQEWADLGGLVRLAFIGLRFHKRELLTSLRSSRDGSRVRYTLKALSGEACLEKNSQLVDGFPITIDEWSKIGRQIEQPRFERLKQLQDELSNANEKLRAAQDWGSQAGISESNTEIAAIAAQIEALKLECIELGIIREPREQEQ